MKTQDLLKPEWVTIVLNRYNYNSIEDMYASIGFGAIAVGKIISRFLEEYKKEHKEENIEDKIKKLSENKSNVKKSSTGIIVKGIDNCLVKLSKCCNPLPGDEIIGYVTRGRGVTVHRTDCKNINDLLEDQNRIIDVEWYNEAKASYSVDIEIYANDRSGLLADIIEKIGLTKAKLMAVNSKANKDKIALTEITVEVENTEELNNVIKNVRKVDSVYEVKRRK